PVQQPRRPRSQLGGQRPGGVVAAHLTERIVEQRIVPGADTDLFLEGQGCLRLLALFGVGRRRGLFLADILGFVEAHAQSRDLLENLFGIGHELSLLSPSAARTRANVLAKGAIAALLASEFPRSGLYQTLPRLPNLRRIQGQTGK